MDVRFRGLLAIAGCIALLGNVAPANAANVVVGHVPAESWGHSVGCGGLSPNGCTFTTLGVAKPGRFVRSPVDGAIVRWTVGGAITEPGYAIRVLKLRGGGEFTAIRTSGPVTPASEDFESFDVDLPVEERDYIGLKVPQWGRVAMSKVPGTEFGFFAGLADGATKLTGSNQGQLAFYAEVQPAPAIAQIAPAGGPTSGGTTVRITGSDFNDVTSVKFGAVPAIGYDVESENALSAIAPPAAVPGSVHVSVSTVAGSSEPSVRDVFAYFSAPQPPAPAFTLPRCVVPDLLGKRMKIARKRARRAHCSIGRVRRPKGAATRNGRIVRQWPKAGKTRRAGAKVTVALGVPPTRR